MRTAIVPDRRIHPHTYSSARVDDDSLHSMHACAHVVGRAEAPYSANIFLTRM
jgi:hypothetical protein